MRTAGSAFFVLFAIVLGVAALPAAWLAMNVVAEEGFVRLASPLADDGEFADALAGELADQATAGVGLPAEVEGAIQPLITELAAQVTLLPGFDAAWDESLRRSHVLTFEGSPEQVADTETAVTLDVAPLMSLVTSGIGEQIGVQAPAPEQTLIGLGGAREQQTVGRIEATAQLWPALAVASGVGAVLALLLARRRSTTLALLGLGVLLGAGALWLAAGWAPGFVTALPDTTAVAGLFRDALTQRAADSFREWCLAALAAGVLLSVAGLVARLLTGRPAR